MVHRGHAFFSVLLWIRPDFFFRDDWGPTETIKKNAYSSQNSKNLQFPASAPEGMEDAQVGERELQATADRNKGTRTTAMPMQVYLGSLSPARIRTVQRETPKKS